MKIEKEIRYYFSDDKLSEISEKLSNIYKYTHSYHEITTMYDNPNPSFTFYSKEIDGRLRLRYSKKVEAISFGKASDDQDDSKCLITWKRRMAGGLDGAIRREEEIEFTTPSEDFDSVKSILEDVLKCKRISSYERIRNFFTADKLHVTCDQFPYGIMLELELKSDTAEQILLDNINKLGLNPEDASNLSCDDMYSKLCNDQHITQLADIMFTDTTMPKIK